MKKTASKEFIIEEIFKLQETFPETQEDIIDKIVKSVLWLGLSEKEVMEVCNDVIFRVKRKNLFIADVLNEKYEEHKQNKKFNSIYNKNKCVNYEENY